jgi:hypothetical protein
MDPVGFEPTISSVQGRRLPARPRAHIAGAGLLVPTRGLEPPRPVGQQILSLSRLPFPPRRQGVGLLVDDIRKSGGTPDSVTSDVLPATVICLTPPKRCGDAWPAGCYPASPAITATRSNHCDQSHVSLTHSPCSQLHARLAGRISTPAGGLLPHPFNPYPHPERMPGPLAGILSVAVVVSRSLLT